MRSATVRVLAVPTWKPRLSRVFLLALTAALNPTLLAATAVMLLVSNQRRLLLGYLLGAYTTGITVGLAIEYWLHGSATRAPVPSGTPASAQPARSPVRGHALNPVPPARACAVGSSVRCSRLSRSGLGASKRAKERLLRILARTEILLLCREGCGELVQPPA